MMLKHILNDIEQSKEELIQGLMELISLESSDGKAYEFRMGESGLPERIEE